MAFSKKHKNVMLDQYQQWIKESKAVFVMSYSGMRMKEIDALRAKAREQGGEIHVVKNTLMSLALKQDSLPGEDLFEGASIVGFALGEAPALAKVLTEATKGDVFAIKGGLLGNQELSANQVKALAALPPLPVMRARLLGAISAPASQLARTIAEPARGLAAVVKAHATQGGESAAA